MKYLESKNLPAIAKELKVTLEEVVEAAKLLPKLDPKPGRNFSGDDAQYITPDVFVYKMGDEYTVVLNDDGLSKLRISGTYRNALKNGGGGPGADQGVHPGQAAQRACGSSAPSTSGSGPSTRSPRAS